MFYNLNIKDRKLRINYGNRSNEFRILKFKFLMNSLLFSNRVFFYYKFYNKKIFFYSWIKNRCVISSRGRGVLKKGHNLTRMQFKKLASNGVLTGWSKSSW